MNYQNFVKHYYSDDSIFMNNIQSKRYNIRYLKNNIYIYIYI